jgi:nucleoside-diphosphate-sugar epimerase
MSDGKRVLITGHNGYIGSVMTARLLEAGHDVVGLDTDYYADCTLVPQRHAVPSLEKDIRDVAPDDLEGFDAIVHLAALSNDPIGNLNEQWTAEINHDATVRLAAAAKAAGVQRFLFSSSCIMYGMAEAALVNEDSPLNPQTEYARSKVRSEMALAEMAGPTFSPTYLRNGTIYGLSPRMRFDTVFNDLVGAAVTARKVTVYSDGTPWRPVVHIDDVSRAFARVLDAPIAAVHNQAFNVGADVLNRQVRNLAELAVAAVPGCTLEMVARAGADQRTYRTDFGKFARTFPDFSFQITPEDGAGMVRDQFDRIGLDTAQFRDRRFTRLSWLQHLLESGRLNQNLRWTDSEPRGTHDSRREGHTVTADR